MDIEISTLIEKIKSNEFLKKISLNKKFLVFLFFVAVSTIFWLLNALSKEYVTTINHPVRYHNFPKDKVLVGKLPSFINIKISAYGFSILNYKYNLITSFKPIDFNVKQLGLRKIAGTNSKYFILTRYEQAKIADQLNKEITLLEIYPDTIYFDLADLVSKKVPVIAHVDFKLDKQTMLNGKLILEPDSIIISGPQTLTDSVDSVFTDFHDFKLLSTRLTRTINIKTIEGIEFEPQKVSLTFPVEKFTETTIKKHLTIKNLPDSLIIKTFPKTIDITYQVALSNFDKLLVDDFIVSIDYNDTKNALGNKLKVQLESIPEEAKKVQFFPAHIEFIIEKK